MYLLLEKGIRVGGSYISNRYSKTNKKYLEFYDRKQKIKQVIYLDANISYGYATFKFLPTSGFKWIDSKEFDLNKYISNDSNWYVLEVDLEYLKELYKLQHDYPFPPDKTEKLKIFIMY